MAFNVPINSIAPLPTPPDWVRPSDWIAITDTANEVQFLVADTGAKAFSIQTSFTRTSGNIYIDWGDGVTDTITTTALTTTNHVYSTGGTPCSRGYNTFKIRIYGDATCVITNVRHIPNFTVTGGSPYYNIGLLEAYYGNGTCSGTGFTQSFISNNPAAGGASFQLLEYVKLPATVTWTSLMTSMFQSCFNLFVVIMPTSASSLTILTNTFFGCKNLLDITMPSNATGITSLNQTFSGCTNLRSVLLPTTLNSCTSLANTFDSCVSLRNITLPSINLCTSLSSTFTNCYSLQWAKLTSLPAPASAGTTVALSNSFSGCSNLQNVYFPSSCSSNAIYSSAGLFAACINLRNIIFPTNFNANTLNTAFNNCFSITNVTFQSAAPNLSNLDSAFANCYLLTSLTLPATVSSSITMVNTFTNCISLKSITIPSAWNITSLSNTFSGCINATSITLPNNAQNSISTMAGTFTSCNKLTSLVLPTSLNAVTSLSSTFQDCFELTSITLPSTMNNVTTAVSAFNSCYALTSLTLPTSMNSCTSFINMFRDCVSIKTITMPSAISSSTTLFNTLVFGCVSLETLTLPTTQTSSMTTLTQMFTGCGNLTTINNLNNIGSLTATPLVAANMVSGAGTWANRLTSLSFSCPFSQLSLNGSTTTTNFNLLNSLRLLNTSAGQWTGTSPQINVNFCDLSTAALNTLFADIAAQGTVVSKTINITSCTGAAGLTAANRLVLTSRGWTIVG